MLLLPAFPFILIPSPDLLPSKYSQNAAKCCQKDMKKEPISFFFERQKYQQFSHSWLTRQWWSSPSPPHFHSFLHDYSEVRKWSCSWMFRTLSSCPALHFVIGPPTVRGSFPSSALKGIPDPNRPHRRTPKRGKANGLMDLGEEEPEFYSQDKRCCVPLAQACLYFLI